MRSLLAKWEDDDVYEYLVESVLKGKLTPEQAAEKCPPLFRKTPGERGRISRTVQVFYNLLNDQYPYTAVGHLRSIWGAQPQRSQETEYVD